MKKMTSLIMALLVAVSLAACGGQAQTGEKKEEVKTEAKPAVAEETNKLEQIKAKGVLVMGTCADYPPYETHAIIDGKDEIVGFDIEIGKEIAKALGVKLKIEDMEFDALLVSLNSDKVDMVIAGMSATEERAQAVDFSMIYYKPQQKIVIRKENLDTLTSLKAFNGKTIGVQKGTIQEEFADKNMMDANKIALGKIPALIMELKSGKSDGIVLEEPVAAAYVSENEDLVIAALDVAIEGDSGSSVAVKKEESEFLAVVDQTIKTLLEEKKIDEMVVEANKWMEQD